MIHILAGDSLVEEFKKSGVEGDIIVFREALITGPIDAADENAFWNERANFVMAEYGEDEIEYHEKVADEILKIEDITDEDEVCLWFEYELFCSVNMWFCIKRLRRSGAKMFRVAPVNAEPDNVWDGFASHDADALLNAFNTRQELTEEDVQTGTSLWLAYAAKDSEQLKQLGQYRSPVFPFLAEVTEAAAEIETRPKLIVAEILGEGLSDIENVFPEFKKRAGVYGFGDLQVERLIEKS